VTPDPADRNGAVWSAELELSGSSASLTVPGGQRYRTARILVRLHGDPVGFVRVPVVDGIVSVADVTRQARDGLQSRIAQHLAGEPRGPGEARGPGAQSPVDTALLGPAAGCPASTVPDVGVTVVVCTRNRADVLRRCLTHLRVLHHPRLHLLIVDNAPSDDATQRLVEAEMQRDERLSYVRELRPGLSAARNRGLAEAHSEVIAYTDDDVVVDPGWATGLARGFLRRDDVACVTGLVASASLDTAAERYFDARVSWSDSCAPRLFHTSSSSASDPLFPYQPGLFGTGANFGFRTSVLRDLGGFDEALGAGSLTAGGEDLDAFVRLLLEGFALAYEPSALVWHYHRSETDELRRQMHAYGTGLTAFVAKHLADPATRREVLRRVPVGAVHLTGVRRSTRTSAREQSGEQARLPSGLLMHELRGMVAGPFLYARARRVAAERQDGTA